MDWEKRFNQLLQCALSIDDPTLRDEFVRGCNPDDPAMVLSLLEAVEEARGQEDEPGLFTALDQALETPLSALGEAGPMPALGESIGSYTIIRTLGEGGMGCVFLCERNDDLRKKAAVKVIRSGMYRPEILRRFQAERDILAALNHPNIGQLHDGGVDEQGRPWYAMEYIDGLELPDWITQIKPNLKQRLNLFLKVCASASYAHNRLVIHRDLKPRNIMVTTDGEPKLLDFGIAAVIDPDTGSQANHTQVEGGRMLSLNYASPEHVQGKRTTAASDIYSLGVILYELLTGELPARCETWVEAERTKLQEPEPPSNRIAKVTDDSRQKRAGLEDQRTLRRRLKGDLDNIVLKALSPDPDARYGSVEGLMEDIQKSMAGLPISARPHTFSYRMKKFIGRHPFQLASLAMFVLLLLSFTGLTVLQQRETERERDRAEQVTIFMTDLFEANSPNNNQNRLTAVELLDRGARRIETQLKDQPRLRQDMKLVMSRIYRKMGRYDQSDQLLQALQQDQNITPLNIRAEIFSELGKTATERGRYEDAVGYLDKALALRGTFNSPRDKILWDQIIKQEALSASELFDEALAVLEPVMEELGGFNGPPGRLLNTALHDRAFIHYELAEYEAAERLLRKVIENEAALGEASLTEHATSLDLLATVLFLQGQLDAASIYYKRAVDLARRRYPDGHGDLVLYLGNYAGLLDDLERFDASIAAYEELMAMTEALGMNEHPDHGTRLSNYAQVLIDVGDRERAFELSKQALTLQQRVLPLGHESTVISSYQLANFLIEMGEPKKAEPHARFSAEYGEKRWGADAFFTSLMQTRWAEVLVDLGRFGDALELINRAETALLERAQPGTKRRADWLFIKGRALAGLGRTSEAERFLLEGFAAIKETTKPEEPDYTRAVAAMNRYYTQIGKPEEAAKYQ